MICTDSEAEGKAQKKKTPTRTSPRKKKPKSTPPVKKIECITNFFGSTPIKRTKVTKAVVEKKRSIPDMKSKKRNSPDSDIYEIPESPMDAAEFDIEIEKALLQQEKITEVSFSLFLTIIL